MPLGMRLPKLLTPTALLDAINAASVGVRLLDCAFVPKPRPPTQKYGHFEPNQNDESRKAFLSAHIPSAVHFDLALATHQTDYEKFAHYPAEGISQKCHANGSQYLFFFRDSLHFVATSPAIFERYAQLLGLNSDDHLVLYGRGPFAGMLFSSRAYWLFKSYGHSGGISLLDGGLDAWRAATAPNLQLVSQMDEHESVFVAKKGNWRAKTEPSSKTVSFEQLVAGDGHDKAVQISRQWLLLDARPKEQFEGKQCSFDPSKQMPTGSHLPGAVNVPSTELVDAETKQFSSAAKLRELIAQSGAMIFPAGNSPPAAETKGNTLVTLCNSGMQASMLATLLDIHFGSQIGDNLRVYTGSMLEVQARAPELINQ